MTVAELTTALNKLDSSLVVYTEGCDCHGDVEFLEPQEAWEDEKAGILLCRSDGDQARKRGWDDQRKVSNQEITARVEAQESVDAPLRQARHEVELAKAVKLITSLDN